MAVIKYFMEIQKKYTHGIFIIWATVFTENQTTHRIHMIVHPGLT